MRVIDADSMLMRINHEVMEAYMDGVCYGVHPSTEWLDLLGEIIDDAPTIDAVPIVRCRECIYSDDGFFCTSPFHGGMTFPCDFCSRGERREDGAT